MTIVMQPPLASMRLVKLAQDLKALDNPLVKEASNLSESSVLSRVFHEADSIDISSDDIIAEDGAKMFKLACDLVSTQDIQSNMYDHYDYLKKIASAYVIKKRIDRGDYASNDIEKIAQENDAYLTSMLVELVKVANQGNNPFNKSKATAIKTAGGFGGGGPSIGETMGKIGDKVKGWFGGDNTASTLSKSIGESRTPKTPSSNVGGAGRVQS